METDVAARIDKLVQSARKAQGGPERRWLMFECWDDLLMASWPVPAASLRPIVPLPLEIDTFNGTAWVSLVPFRATDMRIHGLPPIPGQVAFCELNFRTYVQFAGAHGVYFLSLDCPGAVASLIGSKLFGLPFREATMTIERRGDAIRVESRRVVRSGPAAEFLASYSPRGAAATPAAGSLEQFLTDRLSLFVAGADGDLHRGDIWHDPWLLQPVDVRIDANTIAAAAGITLPGEPPHAAFAARTDSLVYPPARIAAAT